ncbi:YcsE-related riboflavin metabolism phosphatase [Candidatus Mycoplasma pogonae]
MINLNEIKIVASDIDGTILPYADEFVSLETETMFADLKKAGLITVLATGRDMITYNQVRNLKNIDYFIGANGTFIYDLNKNEKIWEKAISYSTFLRFKTILDQHRLPYTVMTNDAGYYDYDFDLNSWYLENHKQAFKSIDQLEHDQNNIHLITIKCDDLELTNKIREMLINDDWEIEVNSVWTKGFFVVEKGINKAKTINVLCKMLNPDWSIDKNVISFGDSSNDYEMIKEAAIGVAVGNADDKIREVADFVCDDVWNNGVYHFFKKQEVI